MPESAEPTRWNRLWHDPVRAERLALLRIAFAGLLLLEQLIMYWPDLAYFYGPAGVAPAGVNDQYALNDWRWTVALFATDDMRVVQAVFFTWMAATLGMALGWRTRPMSVLVWLGAMLMINRNPNLKNGGDDVLQIALFLLMVSHCGRAWSLDAWWRRKRSAASANDLSPDSVRRRWTEPWPIRLFQLQLCMIYLATGLAKLGGEMWWQGTSLHYVLNDVTMSRWSYAQLPLPIWMTAPLTWFSVAFEVLFPGLVLFRATRRYALWLGILFHVGIFVMIDVGWFSFYMMAMYAAWIPDDWFARRHRAE